MWSRLRLRDRVSLGFALMGVVLSGFLVMVSWVVVSRYLNQQRRDANIAKSQDDAKLVQSEVIARGEKPASVLSGLSFPAGAGAVLVNRAGSFQSSRALAELPGDLTARVRLGEHVTQQVTVHGKPYVVVGVPLAHRGDAFFEVSPLSSMSQRLDGLWVILLGAVVGSSLLALGLGRIASRRLLKPLTDVTEAASAIAHGDLSARLNPSTEPDLAELSRAFNRTAAALEQRVRADARFAGDVSHELRTPLTTMMNSVALLQNRRDELPPKLLEPLDLLDEDLHRFRKLVVDLLDISRYDSGQHPPKEPVRVADLVRRAADAAAGRPVTVVDPTARDIVILADKRRLERVFANLVENAEFHGRGCTSVHVRAWDGIVRVEVEDCGPGVPAARRERIFERFVRDGTSGGQGVGLGLAIVAGHVRWHGGQVTVENLPDGGASFAVVLPVSAESLRLDARLARG